MTGPDQEYCIEAVRAGDYPRYLTALYAAADARGRLFALYAFNLELAHVREAVSEPLLGEIRLAWWRETVDGAYAGAPRGHPVAKAMAAALQGVSPPRALFDDMIDGRIAEIDDARLGDVDDLVRYADLTNGAAQEAAAWLAAGGDPGKAASAGARAAGRAWGLAGLIRALGFQARLGRARFPDALLAAQGIDPAQLYRGEITPAVTALARRLDDAARAALAQARGHQRRPGAALLPAFLPAVLAADYLARLAHVGYDLHDPRLESGGLARQMKLAWAAARRRF